MRGPEFVGNRLVEALEAAFPAAVDYVNDLYGLTPDDRLRVPTQVLDHEPGDVAFDDWPFVYVVVEALERFDELEPGGGFASFLATYPVQAWWWVRGRDHDDTDDQRKRAALALRVALLSAIDLVDPDAPTQAVGLNFDGYRENYSDVTLDPGDSRSIAAVVARVLVEVEETPANVQLGVVQDTSVTERLLGFPP